MVKLSRYVVRIPPSVRIALPEAAKTLEQAWQRRRQELAGWQPSGGWLIDPRVPGPGSNAMESWRQES
ncbi:MAG TPA: hypothetical protein VF161_13075 [Steroidobacteraceae bacterium]|jgi:hypothetical protein